MAKFEEEQSSLASNPMLGLRSQPSERRGLDLVLMDLLMPQMDGLEASRRIRAFEKESQIQPVPIIALTAHADSDIRSSCLDAGLDGCVSKPFSRDTLRQVLSSLAS